MPKRVVIVGGGISGLAAAERLARETSAADALDVTLLEASERLGGVIRTERHDGFLLESGPDVMLAAKPAGIELCERLGIADHVVGPRAKGAFILDGRALHRIPEGMSGIVPTRIEPFLSTPILSPAAKLRAALELFVPGIRGGIDESVEQFVVRRFGREMYERLVEPLLSGIYAGDGSRLSIDATFPQLRALERNHGGLIRGMLATRAHASTPSAARRLTGLVSLRDGMGELVDALERMLITVSTVHTRRSAKVQHVTRDSTDRGFAITLAGGETIDTDGVIIATPVYAAARLLESLDGTLVSELRGIECASTITVNVAFRAADIPSVPAGTGYTVPRALGRPVVACTFTSKKFEGRAPDDAALFRLFLGGAGREDVVSRADDAIVDLVRTELREVLHIAADPTFVRVNRYDRVMPQYNIGHRERLERIEARLGSMPGLALAGNGYRGVGIPDCITSGRRAAKSVLDALRAGEARPVSRMAS
jgi:oxygen-dependent protoporphyrinogen oxidase